MVQSRSLPEPESTRPVDSSSSPLTTSDEQRSAPTGPETLAQWRSEVLQRVFSYMFFLLLAVLLFETLLSLQSGQWHAVPQLSVSVLLQALAAFGRRWRDGVRAGIFAAAAWFGMGTSLPILGFALPIPFIVAGMTLTLLALCVGERFALTSLLVLLAILLFDGYYVCFVRTAPSPELLARTQGVLDPSRFSNWIRVSAAFGTVSLAIIGAVGFLVRRLEEAVQRNGKLFSSLEQESRGKIRALEERQVLADKVRRANELQLLGMLSASVAHDFNNLLMVILGNSFALKAEAQGETKEALSEIEQAGERAADLCRRLLTLGRERISGTEIAELNALIEAELPILRRLVTTKVKVDWVPGPPLWLKCARTELRQLLLNLCANARDAMPTGGRLQLSTSRTERLAPKQLTPAAFACLVVSDEGIGMDEATRQRIFEPFFTTKGKANGTGLGMPVVSAAVEQHDGFLELVSEPGKGTTFSLFFPLLAAPDSRLSEHTTGPSQSLSGTETILVVDDDDGVRKMLIGYLQKHGYSVLSASNGEEALTVLHEQGVDLVVSDAVMPRMGGRALFDVASEEQPSLPFLFCSGFPQGTISPEILEQPHRALLPKPFSEQALLHLVRALLSGPKPGA